VGACSLPAKDGEVFEVIADAPGQLSQAQAIAVLTWAAARQEGLTLEEFHGRVLAAASHLFIAPPVSTPKARGGAPARDWEADYGKSAREIEFEAVIRHAARPKTTKSAARRAALMAARTHSSETIATDAEKLKQLMSVRAGKSSTGK
jgi:hypothetical protein